VNWGWRALSWEPATVKARGRFRLSYDEENTFTHSTNTPGRWRPLPGTSPERLSLVNAARDTYVPAIGTSLAPRETLSPRAIHTEPH